MSNPTNVNIAYVNTFKKYYSNNLGIANDSEVNNDIEVLKEEIDLKGISNQEIMLNINSHVGHLSEKQRLPSIKVIHSELFADHPAVTNAIMQDIEVDGAAPIRNHPYGVNARKMAIIKREVDYMI